MTLELYHQNLCELQRNAANRRMTKIAAAHVRSSRRKRRGA